MLIVDICITHIVLEFIEKDEFLRTPLAKEIEEVRKFAFSLLLGKELAQAYG